MPFAGENALDAAQLRSSDEQFAAFRARHARLGKQGVGIIGDDNDFLRGICLMVNPAGHFFDNLDGPLRLSRRIREIGLDQALAEAHWHPTRFNDRVGH